MSQDAIYDLHRFINAQEMIVNGISMYERAYYEMKSNTIKIESVDAMASEILLFNLQ